MLFPYTYRGATIEPMYEPTDDNTMGFITYVEHPQVVACASYGPYSELEQAKQAAETAVDELIESWN